MKLIAYHRRMEIGEPRFLAGWKQLTLCVVTNAHDVFSDRSKLKGTTLHLNHILVGIFLADWKPGSVLVTLDKLPS